jgi:hypothetical protein
VLYSQIVQGDTSACKKIRAILTFLHHSVLPAVLIGCIRDLCGNGTCLKLTFGLNKMVGSAITYAAVVAIDGSAFVLVGMAKSPEGLLTQIVVPLRDFIFLRSVRSLVVRVLKNMVLTSKGKGHHDSTIQSVHMSLCSFCRP